MELVRYIDYIIKYTKYLPALNDNRYYYINGFNDVIN